MLVNGSLTQEFKCSNCLRQGDLLAPFLFLVVTEGLNGLVRETKNEILLRDTQLKIIIVKLAYLNTLMIQSSLVR